MKTQRRHFGALEFINDILLARARLAQAKSDLALAEARAQAVKRGRQGNKPVIHFARKQVRHADTEFIRARDVLAKMEKKYFATVQQAPPQLRQSPAVRVIKEKKPVTVFRGLPMSPPTGTASKQGSISRP
jgi:hypothetical protein